MSNYTAGYNRVMKTAGVLSDVKDSLKELMGGEEEPDPPMSNVSENLKTTGQVGAAAALAPSSYRRLLGIKRLYHGTSTDEAAESIRREGLRTSYGGTGASNLHPEFVERSKGQVHVTPRKFIANAFSVNDYHPDFDLEDAATPPPWRHPRTAAIDLPYVEFQQNFDMDPDFFPDGSSADEWFGKNVIAAKSSQDIDPRYIKGSDSRARGGVSLEALKSMGQYVPRHPLRFLAGAGGLGTSGYLLNDAYQKTLGEES